MFRVHRLMISLLVGVWVLFLVAQRPVAVDFFPLHFAAGLIVSGESPYGRVATAQLASAWHAPLAQAGVAYPLPLLLLIVPLALLPFAVAAWIWTSVATLLALSSVRLAQQWRMLLPLPLLFLPLHRAVVMGQATLLWFGFAVLLLIAMQKKQTWLAGCLIALLVLKPQNGLIFALAGVVWSWRTDRRALGVAGVVGAGLIAGSFAIDPRWLAAWREQVALYQSVVDPPTVLPLGLVLVAACWRLGWPARIAALQVVLFPLSDLYSALPALLIWIVIGGPLAIVGASVSWLWQFLALPNSVSVLWWLVLAPLCVCAAWRSWGAQIVQQRRTQRVPFSVWEK